MNLGEYIKNYIKEDGRTTKWVSEKLEINYKTFVGKLNRNTLSADELFKISTLVDINLEDMKIDLEYASLLNDTRKFIYVAIDNDDEILSRERIPVVKMEIREDKKRNSADECIAYAFVEVFAENKSIEYMLEEISCKNLKKVPTDSTAYMIKTTGTNSSYLLRRNIGGSMLL